jgi:hypothetical protein
MVHQDQQPLCIEENGQIPLCAQGHDWQPTVIIGHFQCARCHTLAACRACVAKVRSRALGGYCQTHLSLRSSDTEQEVLG